MKENWARSADELRTATPSEVHKWLMQSLRQVAGNKEASSFADESENLSVLDVLDRLGSGDSRRHQLRLFPLLRGAGQGALPKMLEAQRKQRLLGRLSFAQVHLLRLRVLVARASFTALLEFRARRPRR
jgi:hypothetical protein